MPEQCMIASRLDRKLALITGAEIGTGFELAGELALRGCNVIMAGKDIKLMESAKEQLLNKYSTEAHCTKSCKHGNLVKKILTPITKDQLITAKLDLGSFESISKFLTDITKRSSVIDLVICNENIQTNNFTESVEGLELHMAVNHIGHYVLIEGLLKLLLKSRDSKLIIHTADEYVQGDVSKLEMEKTHFKAYQAYANSKLAQIMYARYVNSELKNRSKTIENNNLKVLVVNPGKATGQVQKSGLTRLFSCGLVKSVITPWDCVQTTLFAILDENIQSGSYLVDSMIKQPNEITTDFSKCEKLARDSLATINLFKSSGALTRFINFTKP